MVMAMLLIPTLSEARVVSVQMSAPTIAFGGYSWPGVGQYVKITGVAYAEVDPNDSRNSIIVDIGLAQMQAAPGQPGRTASGKVAYLFNFYILKPANLSAVDHTLNGYGKVMYEPPNRGNKTWTALGRVSGGGNDPASIVDTAANPLAIAFLMKRGYTLVWSGWEPLVPLASLGTSLTASAALPVAKNPDGSTITGKAYEYNAPGAGATSISLSYPAADTSDKTTPILTHRVHLDDMPAVVSPMSWTYNAGGTAISLLPPGTPLVANDIYEFSYMAKDPTVAGLGFAAVRDWNSWLKYATVDDLGNANPLANYITNIYTEISSQPGRLLNDFRHLGFNEDESGRKVLDGLMQWIAAGSGIGMNYRFSQSGRTERNRQDHLYAENLFPFANVPQTDPFTGITDSRYAKCQATWTCPLGVEIYSGNEYWVKSASLLHTTADGSRDLPESPYSRDYFMSSMQHGGAAFPIGDPSTLSTRIPGRGACQQRTNPLNSAPVQRALFLALDKWSTQGIPAPDSRVPRLFNGTMTLPANTGFPTNIPDPFMETANGKVTYTGLKTTRYRLLMGDSFYSMGIPSAFPPPIMPPYEINTAVPIVSVNGPIYPSFVPITDSDGNDIPGLRLPDVTVPLATYTGWALRSGVWHNDGCEGSGQFIPFAPTAAARAASGDPRPSVAERYPTFTDYDNKVINAMNAMIQERTLLCEDAPSERDRLRSRAADLGVPGAPTSTASLTPYSFPLANTSVAASPTTLWPPNNKMVPASVAVSVADNCTASCRIVQVTGNDGASAADWQVTGDLTLSLRATRSGGAKSGRTYTVTLQCTDDAGMMSTKTATVTVPHDQGK
jgi:alpha/beta hydrolase family protein